MAELGLIGAETAAKWGLTAANLASLASNPFTMALAAIALVAIAGIVAGILVYIKQTKASTDANYKLTEAQRENA
jgi:hypothetical protein